MVFITEWTKGGVLGSAAGDGVSAAQESIWCWADGSSTGALYRYGSLLYRMVPDLLLFGTVTLLYFSCTEVYSSCTVVYGRCAKVYSSVWLHYLIVQ